MPLLQFLLGFRALNTPSFTVADDSVFGDEFNKERVASRCYRYLDSDVYFLVARRGRALMVHVCALSREARRLLRKAGYALLFEMPQLYNWCRMIIALVKSMSIYNLCCKIGFKDLGFVRYGASKAKLMTVKL